jgi:diguanylate cyclase (GGDEF)-like protein
MLNRSHSEAQRYGHRLSCLMIDLDNFKAVNDRFGHHAGDQALMLAADTIGGELRASDVAARFGGDEFVVLLPHTDDQQAAVLAHRIADCFAAHVQAELPRLSTRLSIGIASLAENYDAGPEALVRAADQALYAAKQGGRNRIEISRVTV